MIWWTWRSSSIIRKILKKSLWLYTEADLNCLCNGRFSKNFVPSKLGTGNSDKCTSKVIRTSHELYIRNRSKRFLPPAEICIRTAADIHWHSIVQLMTILGSPCILSFETPMYRSPSVLCFWVSDSTENLFTSQVQFFPLFYSSSSSSLRHKI